MKFLRSLLNIYIRSSLHVGLAVTALAVLSVMQFGFVPEPVLLLFILLGTISGYNFVKYSGISNRHHLENTPYVFLLRIFTLLTLAGFLYCAWLLPLRVWYMTGAFGGLTVLYAIPIYRGRNLRSLKGLKVLIIAAVWMGMAVLVPLQYHNLGFSGRVFSQCAEIYLLVVVLMIPFEIRDLKYDAPELATFPQILGVLNTKWLGTFLLAGIAILAGYQNYIGESYLMINYGVLVLALVAIWGAGREQGDYYSSFWVESIPILWLIGYLLL